MCWSVDFKKVKKQTNKTPNKTVGRNITPTHDAVTHSRPRVKNITFSVAVMCLA